MSLQVHQLTKRYGGVQALQGITFAVEPGECVALIGPNGAGKSTAFACIAGQQRQSSGHIVWCGAQVEQLAPAQRLRLGIARTFQVAQTFEALTVLQNLQLLAAAAEAGLGLGLLGRQSRRAAQAAGEALAQVQMEHQADTLAGDLPYGARKRLELAMAVLGLPPAQPGLLLLDEPAAGLAALERQQTMQLVRTLASARQLAVLYTEHNMDAVFGVADRVLVLMRGEIIAQGKPDAVANDARVRQAYLGQSVLPLAGHGEIA